MHEAYLPMVTMKSFEQIRSAFWIWNTRPTSATTWRTRNRFRRRWAMRCSQKWRSSPFTTASWVRLEIFIESYLLVQTNKVMELFSRKKIWRLVSLHNGQTNFGSVRRVLSLLFWYLTLQHSLPLGSIRVFISFF